MGQISCCPMSETFWHYPSDRIKGGFEDFVRVDRWRFDPDRVYVQKPPDGITAKPAGLWLSIPAGRSDGCDAWRAYCCMLGIWPQRCWRFPVTVDISDMLVLDTPADIPSRLLSPTLDGDTFPDPDWARIVAEAPGVLLPTASILDDEMDCGWWGTISAASGCVWDLGYVIHVGDGELVDMRMPGDLAAETPDTVPPNSSDSLRCCLAAGSTADTSTPTPDQVVATPQRPRRVAAAAAATRQ